MRYVFLISYDGTDFSGWQRQPKKRTVQETLERAAEEIFKKRAIFAASGRTDAGVHARGQIAQTDAETSIPPEKLASCFNRILPRDVKIVKSALAPQGFDCTRNAKRKCYVYEAYYSSGELPLADRYAARLERECDAEKMRRAAELLVGEHDFSAFRASGFTSKTSVREIYEIRIDSSRQSEGTFYRITVWGNGFLYHMVRILCGELFAVGSGKKEGISSALQTGERSCLAKTMPARGLRLECVDYGVPLFGEDPSYN